MKIDGACHCGEIAYEAELDPQKVGICHCKDCQALSASAFRTIAAVAGESFKLTKGTPKLYVKLAESGRQRVQAFCPNCGSGLYAADVGDKPPIYNLRVGTIRQRDELAPQFECWCESALPWLSELPETKKFPKGPQLS